MEIFAHKGNACIYPENSREAILDSYASPLNSGTELDVRMTKDGIIVVTHWPTMAQVSNAKLSRYFRTISEYTYEELKELPITYHKLDMNLWEKKLKKENDCNKDLFLQELEDLKKVLGSVMTLEEALDALPNDKKLLLEIKDYFSLLKPFIRNHGHSFEENLVKTIKPYVNKQIILNGRNLKLTHSVSEKLDLPMAILIDKKGKALDDCEKNNYQYNRMLIDLNCLSNEVLLKKCLDKNLPINLWTLDRTEQINRAFELIEKTNRKMGIISNRPELVYYLNDNREKNRKFHSYEYKHLFEVEQKRSKQKSR